jgi:hypothetical protein
MNKCEGGDMRFECNYCDMDCNCTSPYVECAWHLDDPFLKIMNAAYDAVLELEKKESNATPSPASEEPRERGKGRE